MCAHAPHVQDSGREPCKPGAPAHPWLALWLALGVLPSFCIPSCWKVASPGVPGTFGPPRPQVGSGILGPFFLGPSAWSTGPGCRPGHRSSPPRLPTHRHLPRGRLRRAAPGPGSVKPFCTVTSLRSRKLCPTQCGCCSLHFTEGTEARSI